MGQLKLAGRFEGVGCEASLSPKGCAAIATDSFYKRVNSQLPGNIEVDERLRPILLEEFEAAMIRALERWEAEHGAQGT
jgi:hypothetical protein